MQNKKKKNSDTKIYLAVGLAGVLLGVWFVQSFDGKATDVQSDEDQVVAVPSSVTAPSTAPVAEASHSVAAPDGQLEIIANANLKYADQHCPRLIESDLNGAAFEWYGDGSVFHRATWADAALGDRSQKRTVMYFGDKIRFRSDDGRIVNGFYGCSIDIKTKEVTFFKVKEGSDN